MLYQLVAHGDYLYAQAQTAKADASVDSNKSIGLGQDALLPRADVPRARHRRGVGGQRPAAADRLDGGAGLRRRQPSRAIARLRDRRGRGCARRLLARQDQRRRHRRVGGDSRARRSTDMVDSYKQFLDPDGKRPGIGDTYRTYSLGTFLKAGRDPRQDPRHDGRRARRRATRNRRRSASPDASSITVGDILTSDDDGELMRVTSQERQHAERPTRLGRQ